LIGYFTEEQLKEELEKDRKEVKKEMEKVGGHIEWLEGYGFKSVNMTDTYYQASKIKINERVKE